MQFRGENSTPSHTVMLLATTTGMTEGGQWGYGRGQVLFYVYEYKCFISETVLFLNLWEKCLQFHVVLYVSMSGFCFFLIFYMS